MEEPPEALHDDSDRSERAMPGRKRNDRTGAEMTDNEKIVRDFIDAWSRLDVDTEIVSFFAPDGSTTT